jgi:hypothetical protein
VKEGKVSYEAIRLIDMEAISYLYGWKPSEILEEPIYYLEAYKRIANSRERVREKDIEKGK